jgi:hypothetical protein
MMAVIQSSAQLLLPAAVVVVVKLHQTLLVGLAGLVVAALLVIF